MCVHLSDVSVPCREQQGGGGGHDAGVVHAGQQEERPHQTTEPALPAVRQTHTHTHTHDKHSRLSTTALRLGSLGTGSRLDTGWAHLSGWLTCPMCLRHPLIVQDRAAKFEGVYHRRL